MFIKKFFIILLSLLLCSSIIGQTVTLDEFITSVLEKHPKSYISLNDFKKTLADNLSYNSIQDWNIFVNYSRTQGATVFGSYTSSAVNSSFEAYTTKSISQYGTTLQLGGKYNAATNQPTIGTIALPDSSTYGLKVQLTQPLLKNAFGRADQYPLKLKTKLDSMAQIVYQQQLQDFITLITAEYMAWVFLEKDVTIVEDQVEKAKKQLKITEKQYKLAAAEELDLITSKQNVLLRENTLLSKKNDLLQQKKKISFYLNGKVLENLESLKPKVSDLLSLNNINSDTVLMYLSAKSLYKKLCDLNETMALLTLDYQTENQKADLNVFLSADIDNYRTYLEDQADANDNYEFTGTSSPFTVGFSYYKPLKGIAQNSAQVSAEESLKKVKNENNNTILNLQESIINLFDQLIFLDNQSNIVTESITLSKKAAKIELLKFEQGRSNSLRFYHDYENQQLSYELQLNQINHIRHSLINQILSFNDVYIAKYNLGVIK